MERLTMFDRVVFETFIRYGEVIEIRVPNAIGKGIRGTVSGYFDDFNLFCEAAQKAEKELLHDGIYFTLQRIDPRLLARAFNRVKPTNLTTSDTNVTHYRWLPIDLDPTRPSGISSSDTELKAALTLRDEVAQWAMDTFELPKPIRAMSGNGGHLLFHLPDMPATDETKVFIRGALESIAAKFDTNQVKIDQKVFNPGRIWKLYGTSAQKGDALPAGPYREARPHRVSYIEHLGGAI